MKTSDSNILYPCQRQSNNQTSKLFHSTVHTYTLNKDAFCTYIKF